MIGEDLQKFSGSRVMSTSAKSRVPIRNLPKITQIFSENLSIICLNLNEDNLLITENILALKKFHLQILNIFLTTFF